MFTSYKRKLIALAALVALSVGMAKPPFSTNGLVLWFRNGPETLRLKDSSGEKNDGKSDSVVVANSSSLVSMQETHQLTLALWIKPNSIPHEFPVLLSKGGNETPGAYGGYELMLNSNGDNDLVFASGGFEVDTHGANGSLINNHLGEWIHVAAVADTADQTIRLYVNGQSYTNVFIYGSLADVNFNVTNNLYIGEPDPAANSNRTPFDGNIRQIMIFNRALSADEIQGIFSYTRPQ